MKRRILVLLIIGFFISSAPGFPQTSSQGDIRIDTQKRIEENGLTVLVSEMPFSSSVSLYALVKTGSATEGKYSGTGISHFMEHMLFKGTQKREMGAIAKEVQALGGTINATTSFDTTFYTISVPSEKFSRALDILADMIMNSKFDPEQLKLEREVVVSEIRLHKDNPDRFLSELVFGTGYLQHPYKLPVIGYEELLRPLTREDLLDYYHEKYCPNNIIVSVSGNLKSAEVIPRIQKAFKDFPRRREVIRNLPQEPQQISPRYYQEEYPTQLTRMSLSYQGLSVLDPDLFAMDVLSMILGQGETSRLYGDLFKKRKLVHSISAANYTPMDQGLFEIESVLDEKNVPETIRAIQGHIGAVQKNGVSRQELEKSKRQVLSDYLQDLQTPEDVSYNTAYNEALTGDFNFAQKYISGVNQVTNEDIMRVARKYLIEQRQRIVILKPGHKQAQKPQEKIRQTLSEIEKIVLDNGVTLLLKENHTLPLVAMTLAMPGGTRYEPQDLPGLSQLTSQVWIKGTQSRNAEELAQNIESRGMRLGSFSGRNSMGITVQGISEDVDFAVDLLEEFVKSPVFDQKEMIKEKDKIKTAIAARDDDIFRVTAKDLQETLFQGHPFGRDSLGTVQTIERIRRQDILDFYTTLAVPEKIVVSVFGDFSLEDIKDKLKARFSRLQKGSFASKTFPQPAFAQTREKTLHLEKKQAMVMIGFPGVSLGSPERYGVEVLTSILGSSMNSRIFKKVREDIGEAYALGGNFIPSVDTGMIYFYVLTTERSVPKVQDILKHMFKELHEQDVSEQELQETKTYLKGTFLMNLDTISSLAFITSMDEFYGLGYNHYQEYSSGIDKVSPQEIRSLAQKYLDWGKAAVVVSLPKQAPAAIEDKTAK